MDVGVPGNESDEDDQKMGRRSRGLQRVVYRNLRTFSDDGGAAEVEVKRFCRDSDTKGVLSRYFLRKRCSCGAKLDHYPPSRLAAAYS
jgi:hypothetical protein